MQPPRIYSRGLIEKSKFEFWTIELDYYTYSL